MCKDFTILLAPNTKLKLSREMTINSVPSGWKFQKAEQHPERQAGPVLKYFSMKSTLHSVDKVR